MRLETAYLAQPMVSPLLEMRKPENGITLPSQEPQNGLVGRHHDREQSNIPTSEYSEILDRPSIVEDQVWSLTDVGCQTLDVNDAADRLAQLQLKLREQRQRAELEASELQTTERKLYTPLSPPDNGMQPQDAGSSASQTADRELRELEAKLKIDLQNVHISPLVRRQKNKHDLRYVHREDPLPSCPSPFPIMDDSPSSDSPGPNFLPSRSQTSPGPAGSPWPRRSADPQTSPKTRTPIFDPIHCCLDRTDKYDRKNLYLLLNNNNNNGEHLKEQESITRKEVYWTNANEEQRYGPQNLWRPDRVPDYKGLCSPEDSSCSLNSTKLDSRSFSSGDELRSVSNSLDEGRPSDGGLLTSDKSSEGHGSSPQPWAVNEAGHYVKRRQKGGYPPRQHGCNCINCNELEAVESCKWLRAAGFPQYAQMYEELRFPLDLACAERDHSFLEPESLQALFRRLRVLNRCARIRLDHQTNNNEEESEDEEQQCALSSNWQFQRHSRRWSRVVCDAEVGKMLDVEPQHFKRSGSERIKDGAKALLKRMESIKTKKKKKPSREGVLISGPLLTDNSALEQRVAALDCIELRTGALTAAPATRRLATRHRSLSRHTPSQGEDSSSLASDQSQNSTPLFRSRRRRKFLSAKEDARSNASARSGDSGSRAGSGEEAISDSESSPPTLRHCLMETTDILNDLNQGKAPPREKRSTDTTELGPDRCKRPALKHSPGDTASFTDAKENFLAHYRSKGDESTSPLPPAGKGDESTSPLPSPDDERHSIYDNVPLIICNKSYQDYQQDLLMDSASTSAPEGSGSSECCTADNFESPCPSQPDTDAGLSTSAPSELARRKNRVSIDRWHSFNRRKVRSSSSANTVGRPIAYFSVGQVTVLRKRALLRLTALMENHAPGSRSLFNNWELPKFMAKRLRPAENKASGLVFGLSVHVTHRRTGYPLPLVITDALEYLEKQCMDQVGLFRKPGVRTRIQKLRELIDAGEQVDFSTYGAYNVADLVKTFFRDMPEGLYTNKLSEVFLTIFQCLPEESRLEAVQCALLLLPDENREALMTLLTFLAEVASHASLNQMTASNLAVCLAPSLFHLSMGGSGSSPLRRKNTSGTPEQKDLHDNKAAHICLQMMIEQVTELDYVTAETLAMIQFTYLDTSQPVCVEDLGMSTYASSPLSGVTEASESPDGVAPQPSADWAAYMDACIAALIKEVKEKNRSYVSAQAPDQETELFYRKVEDDHRLRLWKVSTEVEAPPSELLQRVLRERHDWDKTLQKWRVVAKMDHQSEVFQYLCKSMPPKPTNDFCVLRCWRKDLGRSGGSCALVETSVEHPLATPVPGCSRGIVLVSRYLIQPCGSGKSRVTHISRIDLKGRSSDWYNKVYGCIAANKLARLRDSFKHFAEGPESKV